MAQAEHLAGAAAAYVKNGEEEAVPHPGASIQDRPHFDAFSAIARPRYGLPG
jgi:hypothetical protein